MSSSIQTADREPGPSALASVVLAGLMTSMGLQEDRGPNLDPIDILLTGVEVTAGWTLGTWAAGARAVKQRVSQLQDRIPGIGSLTQQ